MKISLDFDGVIAEKVPEFGKIGKPMWGVKDAIADFQKNKFSLFITTARPDLENVRTWLKEQGFPDLEVTNMKLPADVYVDDNAYRLESWGRVVTKDIMKTAEGKLGEFLWSCL